MVGVVDADDGGGSKDGGTGGNMIMFIERGFCKTQYYLIVCFDFLFSVGSHLLGVVAWLAADGICLLTNIHPCI